MQLRMRRALTAANAAVLAAGLVALAVVPQGAAVADGITPYLEPGDYLAAQRGGTVTGAQYKQAADQAAALRRQTARTNKALAAPAWSLLGPTNVGGRVADLAVDPTQARTVYAAAANGGVWKSTDAGTTFTPSWPLDLPTALGALAAGPDGALYAGTGESNPGGGSTTFGGTGLYKSIDHGATWKFSGLKESGAFGRIAIDPKNSKRVFAAAAGNLFTPGGERGLYRSLDAGATWTRVLEGANATTGAIDVSIDPVNPQNVLAAMWDHQRLPTHRQYAGPGSALYRSTDGGTNWTKIENVKAPAEGDTGRIGVAFSASNPQRAYAVVANKANGNGVGLFKSIDGGATWAPSGDATLIQNQSSYGWWFGRVWVDPADPDHLWVAGLEIQESINGGTSFVSGSNTTAGVAGGINQAPPHADQHAMAFDPAVPGLAYLGNDGGVYRSLAGGRNGTWVGAALQGFTLHFSVDVSEQNPNRAVSGLQDNMCQRNYVGGDVGHPMTWTKYGLCGDGLQTLINPVDDKIVYGCAQYGGNCSKTVDGGGAFTFLGSFVGQRFGWWVPIVFDPKDPNVMYAGTNRVNKSTDGGATWKSISGDLTTEPRQDDPNAGYRIYGTITTISVSPVDSKVIYVGTDDGLLHRSIDGGTSWDEITAPDLETRWVTRVMADPANKDTAYATYSGFRNGLAAPHVLKTVDGGQHWTDISGNLPDAPVNEIVSAGNLLVVGTDVGVYASANGGASWDAVGSGLPVIPIMDLRYHAATKTLTAATFGRGIMRVTLP
jgi:hypothetical protein